VRKQSDDDFVAYVSGRLPVLRRIAAQLAGDATAVPGAWVVVSASSDPRDVAASSSGGPPSDVELAAWRAAATHVATALRIGPGTPVVAPFSMAVPDCTRVKYVNLMRGTTAKGTPFYRYTVAFGTEESVNSTNPLASPVNTAPEITVAADSVATPADKPGSATSEVDGHPTYQDGGFLVVHGVR
jgi:hypothetical protein